MNLVTVLRLVSSVKRNRRQIQDQALGILSKEAMGIRRSELLARIHRAHPETPYNSILGAVHILLTKDSNIVRIGRGRYQLAKHQKAQRSLRVSGVARSPNRPPGEEV